MKTAVISLVIGLMVLAAPAAAQSDDIVAEGQGIGANKQEALMAAKRDAVEKGIGMILLSQTEIENFMVKRDQIVTKTIGAVKSYDVLKEGAAADGSYEMHIKAVLSRKTMRDDLAAFHILIESMDKPRVMVIITENNVGNEEPTNSSAETAIIGFLRDPYEFDIVDPNIAADIKRSQQKMADLAGDAKAAAAIGAKYGAEVILVGTAVSREAKNLSQSLGGMVSVQADVTLKAINCSSNRIIATSSGHGAQVHISPNTAGNEAIKKGAVKAATELLDAIIKEWQNQLNNGITIRLVIKGVGTYRLKNNVMHTISSIGNISAARERGWNAQSRLLEVDLQYKGNVDGFCSRMDGYKLRDGGGSLAVTGVNGMSVELTAQPL
ncbi:MAG: hypothetical protein GF331_05780 [Chitinivibrionales bacterium]|nr:hypothetical protein [Chitinivibrionales bacterium]